MQKPILNKTLSKQEFNNLILTNVKMVLFIVIIMITRVEVHIN